MDDSEQPYWIQGRKAWLSPTAREFAWEFSGLSPDANAKSKRAAERKYINEYLRLRQSLGDEYQAQTEEQEDAAQYPNDARPDVELSGEPSVNIEDRRAEGPQLDITMRRVNPQPEFWGYAEPNYSPNPLANALGFGDVGQRPAPVPQGLYPSPPTWPLGQLPPFALAPFK